MPSSACASAPRHLHPFPTRRSSDLWGAITPIGPTARHTGFYLRAGRGNFVESPFVDSAGESVVLGAVSLLPKELVGPGRLAALARSDRKSTRLNSSHSQISYAVFCLCLRPPPPPSFPYTTLFRSLGRDHSDRAHCPPHRLLLARGSRQFRGVSVRRQRG